MTIDTTDCEQCGTLGVSIGANCPRCGGLIPHQCNRDALINDLDELDRINNAGDRYGHITPGVVAELIAEVRRLREAIRLQANTVRTAMDANTHASGIRLELAEQARAESSPEVLASERAINAMLTEENEELREDAERYRWLCNGNGYFLEEEQLCGHFNQKSEADEAIDAARKEKS